MYWRTCLVLVLALGIGRGTAQAQASIPKSPAGNTLQALLKAFNSNDPKQMSDFLHTYQPGFPLAELVNLNEETGGFDLVRILKSRPLELEMVFQERKTGHKVLAKMDVKSGQPAPLAGPVLLFGIPPDTPLSAINFSVDEAARAQAIDGAIEALSKYYLFPKVAEKMAATVRAREKSGAYNSVTDGQTFARMLTADFRSVSHDKHLRVNFSPVPIPKMPPVRTAADIARFRKEMEHTNCAFRKVEILPGNIGYLKFNAFADPQICGPTAIAAMNFLASSDALIIDLRQNGGGDPQMVQLICTYLFAGRTHLNNIWQRKGDKTTQYWTLSYVPGKRLAKIPVYLLTSKRTFSGAEEFTYDLKNLKRVTIVGETTGGGAHLVNGHRIDAHFVIGVPFAEAINPVSKTNWEGTGVVPDVKVPAADALATAQKLAEQKLASEKQKPVESTHN